KFTAFYSYPAVMDDLGVKGVKNPRFLIATGTTDMRINTTPAGSLGKGVIYVTELTSGKIAAYAIPYSRTLFAGNQTQTGKLVPIDMVTARSVAIRPN